MSLTKYEIGTTFRSTVTWVSGSSYIDASGNMSYFTVYDPNGNIILEASGSHDGTGIYTYYYSTQSNADLGIYVLEWKAYFNYGTWSFSPKYEREAIQITFTD